MMLPPSGPNRGRASRVALDGAPDIDVEVAVEVGFGGLLDRREVEHAGIVHQHVQLAEGLFGLTEQPFDIGRVGHIALDRDGLAALGLDVGHSFFGAGFVAGA